jgi:hypothetical protein
MNPLSIVVSIAVLMFILWLVRYIMTDPNTLSGLTDGTVSTQITSDNLAQKDDGVPDSNFAYSIWFYINDWNYRYGEPKILYGRMGGTGSTDASGNDSDSDSDNCPSNPQPISSKSSPSATSVMSSISGVDPCPVVIFGEKENNLIVALGCYPGADEEPTTPGGTTVVHTCGVGNIPIQKWTNLVISVYGRTLDIYIDGKLVRTCLLPGVANVNENKSVYVTPMGGFDGWTSKFQYYSDSLNPQQVWNIYSKGYTSGLFAGNYQLQMSVLNNGTTQDSYTIG